MLDDAPVEETAEVTDSSSDAPVVDATETVETAPASELPPEIQAKLDQYESYKAAYEYAERFGGVDGLQSKVDLDEAIRSGDVDRIDQAIAERSAKARVGLANKYGSAAAAPVDEMAIVRKYFGPDVNQETISEFQKYREADRFSTIPEEFRFVKDEYTGQLTPRAADDPILVQAQYFQRLLQGQAEQLQRLQSEVRQPKEVEAQQRFQQTWKASQDRLVDPVKAEATKLGLYTAPANETPEAKAVREYQLESFVYATTGKFQKDHEKDLEELAGHYQRGELVAAREKEAVLSRKMRDIAQKNIQVVGKNWTGALQKKAAVTKTATSAKPDAKTVGGNGNVAKLPELLNKVQQSGKLDGLRAAVLKDPRFAGRDPDEIDRLLGQRFGS